MRRRRGGRSPTEFDFVIVGAGTAGCILAARLSEGGRHAVAVIEAGRRGRNPLLSIPAGVGRVWSDPAYNWNYLSEPEAALGGRVLRLPRGRVVGGSSAINAMNFVRGWRADFDAWARMGLSGWGFDDILPHFRRCERFEGGGAMRGDAGPIGVTTARHDDPLVPALFAGLHDLGHRELPDYNAAEMPGYGRGQFNIEHGRRQDAGSCFLVPALGRGVELIESAKVRKLVLAGGRVSCVEFERLGIVERIAARREVVLAAGAFNTPQLLKLSGVGPHEELRRHGIEVAVDSRGVGRNLIEHARIAIDFARKEPSAVHRMLRADRLVAAMARSWLLGSGPASEPLAAAHLFATGSGGGSRPNFQFLFRLFNPRLEVRLPFVRLSEPDCFGIVVCLLHPESRGTVELRSADHNAVPSIRMNLLSADSDVTQLAEGLRIARSIGSQPALAALLDGEFGRSADAVDAASVAAFIRDTADTIFHPAGSCAMGAGDSAPLTAELRVRGVENLRVVDASVMPGSISGNINAAVMMVAEKASAMILADAAGALLQGSNRHSSGT